MRGPVHKYLGMTINFSVTGKVKFSMIDHVKDMLEGLPDDMTGESVMPGADHLFSVNSDAEQLNTAEAKIYHHHNTAKLLFLCVSVRGLNQTYKRRLHFCVLGYSIQMWMTTRNLVGSSDNYVQPWI